MLSLFSGVEREQKRLIRASQSLHDYTHRYFSATNAVLGILNQHLYTEFTPIKVRENLSLHQNFTFLMNRVQEIHAAVELTDRHVQKNISRPLYDKITLYHTSLQEIGVIIRDFHMASMGIFGSICGPITSVLLRHGNLPENLESAVQLLKASPVLTLQVANLLLSCSEIAMAISPQAAVSSSSSGPQHKGNAVIRDNPDSSRPALGQSPESNEVNQLIPNHNVEWNFSFYGLPQWYIEKFSEMFSSNLSRNTMEAAANEMEEVACVLKRSYKSFQYIVDKTEVYITLINETQQ
ncbi:hypothetical protein G0U57_002083 [Chelydra serpentina]|uniref:Uncharacterized protein n=1 Tax=Chelydra serpentina TaxID=8475 RepID=A0A8T1S1J5_CHESE|nr:hypothetical protein G0U57_002083 [Chelydra serpentina]